MNRKVYQALRYAHFLPEEAREFAKTTRITSSGKRIKVSAMPLNVPYIKDMIRERARAFRRGVRDGLVKSLKDWREVIIEGIYIELGFLDEDGNIGPWQLLRYNEDKYKDQHPEYQSPYKAKRKTTDFVSKYAKGLEAYERGRGR